ncbi:hypothetical protein KIN20_005921 [Parelaphostrongylus tenuis]|uniref:39S ribosomal protein L52, mitochondrial n=1 Tax=Parelaphostrongylus tenuis TaxID=148309 RepID=A0AAD5MTE8_PARTN|nr:hypothetical protein KIN20_005921 [Parelaphostrongylus tenuis]
MFAGPSILRLHYYQSVVPSTINIAGVRYSSNLRGRFQHWKKPVYSAPHVNPLELGPDFSVVGGRPIQVTSKIQLEHKLDQLRLAKKVVKLLSDINEMEDLHKKAETQRLADAKQIESIRPKSKGMKSIAQL